LLDLSFLKKLNLARYGVTIMNWIAKEAEAVTKGKIFSDWQGEKIVFDSRLIEPGDIFLALPGANVDGHNYVSDALKKGAAAAIVSRIPENLPNNEKLLLVDDVIQALQDMANYKRNTSKAKFIAITGSVGKTSTKELLQLAFSAHGKTFSSRANYNNFLGVPINLASLPNDAEYAIFEIGMDHAGEITPLSDLVKPHITIITAIENIHRANFDSLEGIANAKAEIFHGIMPAGMVILNSLSNCYEYLKGIAIANYNIARIYTIGADSKLSNYSVDNSLNSSATFNILGQETEIKLNKMLGIHQMQNILTALSCVASLQLDLIKSIEKIQDFQLPRGRGLVSQIDFNGFKITLIDDSYNAGPVSIKAALKTMSYYPGRKIAILGDMTEMGPESEAFHLGLQEDIINNNIDKVICFGKQMGMLHETLPKEKQFGSYLTLKDLAAALPDKLLPNDILLIKGSYHLTKLYHFTKHLMEGTLDAL